MDTVWVMGDQLNRGIGALAEVEPGRARVLLVESDAHLRARPYHRQRLHLVVTAMRRFGAELAAAGFDVDHRRAPTFTAGLADHRAEHGPDRVVATEANSFDGQRLLDGLGVEQVRSNQFLCHADEFAGWAAGRSGRLRMEDFYRDQRRRLGYLMDGDHPVGGRWNLDTANREPPPADGGSWPEPVRSRLDDIDRDVLAGLPDTAVGDDPTGWWPTSRRQALARLRHFVDNMLPAFGPHQDAMLADEWHLAHSLLSPALNLGLLLPGEVADAAESAFRAGGVPLSSAEGFIRQVIGWREYVWGLYWLWMPGYRRNNRLRARRPLPAAFDLASEPAEDPSAMRCVSVTVGSVRERGWAHHIQRLMVLANLSLTSGVRPQLLTEWMRASFVDGADWVMVPNVVGMGLHADGGRMATKPYASGGAYIDRMSDYCADCRYDPKARTGDDACPFTTLYWDFLARNRDELSGNGRMARPLQGLDRLSDLDAVRARARTVRRELGRGRL